MNLIHNDDNTQYDSDFGGDDHVDARRQERRHIASTMRMDDDTVSNDSFAEEESHQYNYEDMYNNERPHQHSTIQPGQTFDDVANVDKSLNASEDRISLRAADFSDIFDSSPDAFQVSSGVKKYGKWRYFKFFCFHWCAKLWCTEDLDTPYGVTSRMLRMIRREEKMAAAAASGSNNRLKGVNIISSNNTNKKGNNNSNQKTIISKLPLPLSASSRNSCCCGYCFHPAKRSNDCNQIKSHIYTFLLLIVTFVLSFLTYSLATHQPWLVKHSVYTLQRNIGIVFGLSLVEVVLIAVCFDAWWSSCRCIKVPKPKRFIGLTAHSDEDDDDDHYDKDTTFTNTVIAAKGSGTTSYYSTKLFGGNDEGDGVVDDELDNDESILVTESAVRILKHKNDERRKENVTTSSSYEAYSWVAIEGNNPVTNSPRRATTTPRSGTSVDPTSLISKITRQREIRLRDKRSFENATDSSCLCCLQNEPQEEFINDYDLV